MKKTIWFLIIAVLLSAFVNAQPLKGYKWTTDGKGYYKVHDNAITKVDLPSFKTTVVVDENQLTPKGKNAAIDVENFFFSNDGNKILIYTNSKKVWRYKTRGDYWLYDFKTKTLKQLGAGLPSSSLMFAKFSPDASKVAYVSEYNIYVEDISSGKVTQLTKDGTRKLINGTFDWVYEEEFFCRDGFRWSPDSKQIAFWQIDAKNVKDYLMINNTDSIYPFVKPVEYPVAGEAPSPFKIGIVNIETAAIKWMDIPTDPVLQSYVPRMEWAHNSNELIVQHLNRKQNQSDLMICNAGTGDASTIYHETDSAWIDILPDWDEDYSYGGWDWLNEGKEFIWASEKDGWRHLYSISRGGKNETLITTGKYDVIGISTIDEKSGYIYFFASPGNATQKYLYRTKLDGKSKEELLSPINQPGTHNYEVSPTGSFAYHNFSNYYTPPVGEFVSLPDHKSIAEDAVNKALSKAGKASSNISFFKVKTKAGVEMDAWMAKPDNFDSTKKYPVVFFVYSEPAGQNVIDKYNAALNKLYNGDMAKDGYIYISVDNRGTPVPKGRQWRKSIYRKIGLVNINDQAMAATEIFKRKYIDTSRVAVWGWSGGGSATLNLMFQHPEIYKTGIAIAAVGNELTYDNIYQERYMGLPQQNRQDFIKGSPITYAKNLQGHLLYIHGTGDDNVHYSNAEMLLNELIKYNRQFQFMAYPNRTHSISEGEGTDEHLRSLYTQFLHTYCPPGAR